MPPKRLTMLAVAIHGARLRLSSRLELQSLCGSPIDIVNHLNAEACSRVPVTPRPVQPQATTVQRCVSLAVHVQVASSQTRVTTIVLAVCCCALAAVSSYDTGRSKH